jgi:ATP-dependent DNA ligase
MKEIYLEKESSTGKPLFWRAINKGESNYYTHGQIGGKEPIPKVDRYTEGKNIGKKNETTPEQQALFDMETTALKKIDSGYKLIKGEISEHKSHVKVSGDFKMPMKAHKWKEQGHKLPEVMYAQPKLDGIRCNGELDGSLKTIKGKPTIGTPHVNEAIQKIAPILKANGIVRLDGELYSHDLTFEEIISVTKQTKTLSNDYRKVALFVFDVITEEPMNNADRIRLLNVISKHFEDGSLVLVKTDMISKHQVEEFHTKYVSQGYEGIMLRAPKGMYEHKRSYLLQKYKHFI